VRFSVFEGGSTAGEWSIIHEKCNHCASPSCLKICPEKAIFKEDGWTIVDHDRCIGCGACENVCPYDAVHVLREKTGLIKNFKSYKCHGCLPTGLSVPACASVCPTGALTFDFRMRLIQKAKKREAELRTLFPDVCVYGLEPFGGLNVITILKNRNLSAGMEKKVSRADGNILGSHFLYFCFRPITLGFDRLKRKAWRLSSALSDGSKVNNS
jgi:Fe-S-cluster-containing dehydrogenase component